MTSPGATPADWTHFSLVLGLTEHLLPVVSNPRAVISSKSTLRSIGKVPSRYDINRHVVGIGKWTALHATPSQVDHWSTEHDYGICIQTRFVRALDIDIDDAAKVGELRQLIHTHLGPLPCRVRPGSHRVLLAFSLAGDLEKRSVRIDAGMVELLATGQQFIAAGTHPSGGRYFWEGGLPEDIPTVSLEALNELWVALGGEVKGPRTVVRVPGAVLAEHDTAAVWLEAQGWVLTERSDGRLLIQCPWRDDHTGDSGPTETVYWPSGTGGYAQGHFKCLHAHCDARTDEEFLGAIGFARSYAADFPDVAPETGALAHNTTKVSDRAVPAAHSGNGGAPVSWYSSKPGEGLRKTKKGWAATIENVARAVATPHFWRRLGYDEFRCALMSCDWDEALGQEEWSPVTAVSLIEGRQALERAGFEPVSRELMRDAVETAGWKFKFDSAQLWLNAHVWDGVPRVDSFFQTYCGALSGGYARAVGRYLWSALAGRVLSPGVKADMVPILQGVQGEKKSWSLKALAPWPDAYVSIDLTHRDADLARRMRGRVIWGLPELRGLHTRERTAINDFISEQNDTWIPKHVEFATNLLRRGVFIGDTNDSEILDDETGNRRWLPIAVAGLKRDLILQDRAQLWAEGATIFMAEGVVWEEAERLGKLEHEAFKTHDIWEEELTDWLARREDRCARFTTREAALGIGLDPRVVTRATEMRLGKALRNLVYTKVRARDQVGTLKVFWESKA